MTSKNNELSIDLLSILAIGGVSFIAKNVIHEAFGAWRRLPGIPSVWCMRLSENRLDLKNKMGITLDFSRS